MIEKIQSLTDEYYEWLKENTNLRLVEDWVEITTPYLDRHNDCIQIYAKRTDAGFELTDDGYTLYDLETSGCKIDTPKRRALLNMTLNGFGVVVENDAILVRASVEEFAFRKHNLLQAMLAINDLFYLASATVRSLFFEEVISWLDASEIRYTANLKFAGRSGFDHRFDFVIPKSKQHPERMLFSINNPNRDNMQRAVFSWGDTREARGGKSLAYALLNDGEKPVAENVLNAFRKYSVQPVQWSNRESVREELVA
ncbi:MAG: DUF1829 domain-containing protein [Anaerolineaceae bacterium]|nr:DUF1829 domain-containing protein [Anaerolineaceae bacterium]